MNFIYMMNEQIEPAVHMMNEQIDIELQTLIDNLESLNYKLLKLHDRIYILVNKINQDKIELIKFVKNQNWGQSHASIILTATTITLNVINSKVIPITFSIQLNDIKAFSLWVDVVFTMYSVFSTWSVNVPLLKSNLEIKINIINEMNQLNLLNPRMWTCEEPYATIIKYHFFAQSQEELTKDILKEIADYIKDTMKEIADYIKVDQDKKKTQELLIAIFFATKKNCLAWPITIIKYSLKDMRKECLEYICKKSNYVKSIVYDYEDYFNHDTKELIKSIREQASMYEDKTQTLNLTLWQIAIIVLIIVGLIGLLWWNSKLTETTVDKPTELTETTADKLAELTETTVDKPTELTETTEDKLAELTETTEDKLAELIETTEDKPTELTETIADKPQNKSCNDSLNPSIIPS